MLVSYLLHPGDVMNENALIRALCGGQGLRNGQTCSSEPVVVNTYLLTQVERKKTKMS